MPIYDYRCDECGHVFSAVQSYSEGPIQICPNCGKRPRRLISMPAIVFKGGGWYKTDSRGAAPKEAGDGGSTVSGATGGDTKSDSKPDKGSDAKSEKGRSEKGRSDAKPESKSDTTSESASSSKTETKPSSGTAKSEPKS